MKTLLSMCLILLVCVGCENGEQPLDKLYILTDVRGKTIDTDPEVIEMEEELYGAWDNNTKTLIFVDGQYIEDENSPIAGGYRITFYNNNTVKMDKYLVTENIYSSELSNTYKILSVKNGIMRVAENNLSFVYDWKYELTEEGLNLRTHFLDDSDLDLFQEFVKMKDL